MARGVAELLADDGAAASTDEFFRSPPYLGAEGVTHTLRIETAGAVLVAPLLVREIPGGEGLDAVSPYGYPGVVVAEGELAGPLAHEEVDWSPTGLVSLFARGTALGPHALAGAARGTLQISDPAAKRKSRPTDRRQVRRNEDAGYAVTVAPGPDSGAEARAGFRRVYEQTMVRTAASERYFFDRAWFDAALSSERTWLVTVAAPGGGTAAASIGALSDGVLHYFLSGTDDAHLREAPMKNLIVALQDLSAQLGAPLNLGGGLSPGDGLEEFKRGFANRREPFVTHEVVCDRRAYERLSAEPGAAEGFFPAYRAP
ncbi:MAG TPA: GNAT family N-acetyltransferase [Solirubrobacterales bacterium]